MTRSDRLHYQGCCQGPLCDCPTVGTLIDEHEESLLIYERAASTGDLRCVPAWKTAEMCIADTKKELQRLRALIAPN